MEPHTRRRFYTVLISGLGTIIGVATAIPTAMYLLVSRGLKPKGHFVEVASLNQLQVGKPQEVTFERTRVDGWRTVREKTIAWVVRIDKVNVVAYSPQCTHLGCSYHWEAPRNQFVCPCHESRFSVDGEVFGGPAAR